MGALARLILPILARRSSTAQPASSGMSHRQQESCELLRQANSGPHRASWIENSTMKARLIYVADRIHPRVFTASG